MTLVSNRHQDRVHWRDLIDVGLVGRAWRSAPPHELADRLDALVDRKGR